MPFAARPTPRSLVALTVATALGLVSAVPAAGAAPAGDLGVVGSPGTATASATAVAPLGTAAASGTEVVAVVTRPDGSLGVETTETGSPAGATQVVAALNRAPHVLAAEVSHPVRALTSPNDTYFACQWALHVTATTCDFDGDDSDDTYTPRHGFDVSALWDIADGTGVTVAVVDSGVRDTHEDLAGQVLTGYDFIAGKVGGSRDGFGHGTHVAGIIAAAADNGIGVSGLAPGAKILPVRVLDSDGFGDDATVAQGIIWATQHGADVINLSLGGEDASAVQAKAIQYALSKGVVVLAAAGNDAQYGNPTMYPAAIPGVIAVGAADYRGRRASFSEHKPYVAVTAPGVDIASTYISDACGGLATFDDSCYAFASGTSMATPFASAAAALLLSRNPALSPGAVGAYLTGTAVDAGATGRDDYYGFGNLDALAALTRVDAGTSRPTSVTWRATTTRATAGTTLTVHGTLRSRSYRVPHRSLALQRRTTSGSWRTVDTAWTDGNGVATFTVKVTRTTRYRIVLAAQSGLAGSVSGTGLLVAKKRITARSESTRRGRITVSAKVTPGPRVGVRLQYRPGKYWKTLRVSRTTSTGAVRFGNVTVPSGVQTFRLIAPRTDLALGATRVYRFPVR